MKLIYQCIRLRTCLFLKFLILMKLSVIFLISIFLQQGFASNAQGITIAKKNAPLRSVLMEVRQQSGYDFFFEEASLKNARPISVNIKNTPLNEALKILFKDQPFSYSIVGTAIVIRSLPKATPTVSAIQQSTLQHTLKGRVTDEEGESLIGVNVSIKGTSKGTTTDVNGEFLIEVNRGDILSFTYIGFIGKEVTYSQQPSLNVTLQNDNTSIDEVVVIGYGTQRRSEITGAISSISGEDISKANFGGLQEALQGKVAGVNITPTSGQPGGALDMNIRGVATFGNGNPLFVIDGVPTLSDGSSRNFNPLASLNPDNIQSVQILKDASASAIYGARAANGVVIITTNRGESGETQLQFKASGGISEVTKFLPLMTSDQYIPYAIDAYQNSGRPIPVSLSEPLKSQNLQTNTDWQKEGFKSAVVQNYWLGISGGSEFANYSFSMGYLDQEGTLPNSGFKRYSVRVNSDFNKGKRLKFGETIELSRSAWTGTFNQASYTIRQLLQQSPTVPVYDPDSEGGFDGPRLEYSPVGRQNSIGELTLTDDRQAENKLAGNIYGEYEILPGLTNRFSFGGEVNFGNHFQFLPTYRMGDRERTIASLNERNGSSNAYLVENVITYKKIFNEVHNVTFLAGFSQQEFWNKNTAVEVRGFPNNDLRTIAAAFENRNITGNETHWALRSQIGRLSYAYKQTYNLMATIRRDGSSRFGKNNRFGVFPSLSGSWLIKNEAFLRDYRPISTLTLRASHGQVGSQEIDDFAQYAMIEQSIDYIFGDDQVLSPGSTYLSSGNPDLKWEVTTQTNIGLDIGFFKNKLNLNLDYYIKNTDDILLQLPVPTTSGIRRNNGPFVNAGSMQNKGLELTVSYQNGSGDFGYLISGNLSTNKNKITKLHGDLPIIAQINSGKQSALTLTKEGNELGSFYGYVMEGVFKDWDDVNNHATQSGAEPGDVKYLDLDKNGIIDADDQTILGSPFPDFTYGLNSTLTYKNFDVMLALNGKQGHQIYNLIWSDLNEGEGDNNATIEMLNRWTESNPNTNIPRAVTGNPGQNTRPSSRFIENGSFLRIQNIQLGYNLSNGISSRLKTSLRVYISAKNLLTITNYRGYNPEIGLLNEGSRSSLTRGIDVGMYPIPRTIEAGIQIGL